MATKNKRLIPKIMLPDTPLEGYDSYRVTYDLLAERFGKEKWIHRQVAIAYLNTRPEMPSPTSVSSRISYMVRDGWLVDNNGNKRTRGKIKAPPNAKRRAAHRPLAPGSGKREQVA